MAKYESWLKKYPSIQKFNKLIDRGRMAQKTAETYINDVRTFCELIGFDNPEKTIEHIQSIENKEDWLDNLVGKFSKEHGDSRCVCMFRAVKRWIELNKIDVDWRDIVLPSVTIKIEDRAPTKQELKRIISVCGIRDKSLVLFASSSGLRANTIRTLTYGDVNFQFPDIAEITVKRQYQDRNGQIVKTGRKISKKRNFFTTFITPESKKALLDYIKYRKEQGETITSKSPLFTGGIEQGKMLSKCYIGVHWGRLLKRAHLNVKSGKWNILHFHTLRKFTETQFINAGCKPSYREFWLGHKGAYLESNYFRGEQKDHLREYRKAIEHLSIIETKAIDRQAVREEYIRMMMESDPKLFEKQAEKHGMTTKEYLDILKMPKPSKKVEQLLNESDKAEDCQHIVSESELSTWLTKGFKVVAVLPSGKIVVSNE